MKRLISVCLLLIYLGTFLRPAAPYLDYLFNKDYIASQLCENKARPKMKCDGKCYLKKQVRKSSEQENDPATNQQVKVQSEISPQVPSEFQLCLFKEESSGVSLQALRIPDSQFLSSPPCPPPWA